MTVSPGEQGDVRRMDRDGVPRAQIARKMHLSRNTVARYADRQDMSPEPPVPREKAHLATDAMAAWIDPVPEADLSAPKRQRHTARRIYGRAVAERGCAGSYSSVRRHVARWKEGHATGPREGYLGLEWAPGTAQVDLGDLEAVIAGAPAALKLPVATFPHPSARLCVALACERAEVFCAGLRMIFEWAGRAPRTLVPGDATEAGGMPFGKIVEPRPLSHLRAHCRCGSRHRGPCSGNERGSVESAVGLLRRNLLVPVPEAASPDGLNEVLHEGCERTSGRSEGREGKPTREALAEDLAGMLALPGVPFDAVRWQKAKSDKRGYVRTDGNPCRAGPAWHDRGPVVGVRAETVEVPADRGRHVATLPRSLGQRGTVRDPASPMPALVAGPRASGESVIRRDMPQGLADAIDRLDEAGRRQAPRVPGKCAEVSGFEAACEAEGRVPASGRIPDEASADMLARRIAAGGREECAGPDLPACDGFLGGGVV